MVRKKCSPPTKKTPFTKTKPDRRAAKWRHVRAVNRPGEEKRKESRGLRGLKSCGERLGGGVIKCLFTAAGRVGNARHQWAWGSDDEERRKGNALQAAISGGGSGIH